MTFSGAVIKSGANSVGAAIKVDGVTVEPTDHGYTYVVKSSSWGTAAISMTRCLRVRPGKHSVSVALGANLGGPAYVREYTIRIDQYKLSASRRATLHSRTVTSLAYKFFATTAGLVGRPASRQGLFQVTRAAGPTMLARWIRERGT